MLVSAECLPFYKKQSLIVTNEAGKLLRELLFFKKKAENLLLESNELLKPMDQIDWTYKQQHDLGSEAEHWERSKAYECFQPQTPYCMADENNVVHSSIGAHQQKFPSAQRNCSGRYTSLQQAIGTTRKAPKLSKHWDSVSD